MQPLPPVPNTPGGTSTDHKSPSFGKVAGYFPGQSPAKLPLNKEQEEQERPYPNIADDPEPIPENVSEGDKEDHIAILQAYGH